MYYIKVLAAFKKPFKEHVYTLQRHIILYNTKSPVMLRPKRASANTNSPQLHNVLNYFWTFRQEIKTIWATLIERQIGDVMDEEKTHPRGRWQPIHR